MTEDEARKLAQRIIDTWPTGPRAYIWRDILIPLDAHLAAGVYRTMRDNLTRPPTTGEFKIAYKQALARTITVDQPTLPLTTAIGPDHYIATHPHTEEARNIARHLRVMVSDHE